MMNRIFVTLLLISATCRAQESFDGSPLRGMVGVTFGRIPQTKFSANTGTYESRWSGINAVVPVYRSISTSSGELSFQQINLTGSFRRNTAEFSLLAEPRNVTSGWLGGAWFFVGESKNFYTVSASVGIAEDKMIGGSPTARFRMTAIGSYHLSNPFLLLYGLNYSALFGRDLILPILGARWRINNDWSSSLILPFSFSVRYRASSSTAFHVVVSASGDRILVANRNDFAVPSNDLKLSMTGMLVAIRGSLKISEDFSANVELGSIVRRTMTIQSENTTLSTERLENARHFSIGIRYRFSADDNNASDEN